MRITALESSIHSKSGLTPVRSHILSKPRTLHTFLTSHDFPSHIYLSTHTHLFHPDQPFESQRFNKAHYALSSWHRGLPTTCVRSEGISTCRFSKSFQIIFTYRLSHYHCQRRRHFLCANHRTRELQVVCEQLPRHHDSIQPNWPRLPISSDLEAQEPSTYHRQVRPAIRVLFKTWTLDYTWDAVHSYQSKSYTLKVLWECFVNHQ